MLDNLEIISIVEKFLTIGPSAASLCYTIHHKGSPAIF